jgi:hypothetical protein
MTFPQGVLLCGLSKDQVAQVIAGPQHGGHSLASLLRFVAVRDANHSNDIAAIGGPWNEDLDGGGDPSRSAAGQSVVGSNILQGSEPCGH